MSSQIHANPASPAPAAVQAPRASVMAIMKDAGQALLWDGNRGEYVVVRLGDRFQRFVVTAIEAEQVVLSLEGSSQHFVLPRTSDTSEINDRRQGASQPGAPGLSGSRPYGQAGTDLLDPYPRPVVVSIDQLDVLDPYGIRGQINSVTAPPGLRASEPMSAPVQPLPAQQPAAPAQPLIQPSQPPLIQPAQPLIQPAPSGSAAQGEPARIELLAPVPVTIPAEPVPARPATGKAGDSKKEEQYTVSRREFDAAVTDFHALSKEMRIELLADGVRLTELAAGTLFHRWGLRAGDVVQSVDGHSIRGVDDAAAVYARLMDAKTFMVKVKRAGESVTLRYRFVK